MVGEHRRKTQKRKRVEKNIMKDFLQNFLPLKTYSANDGVMSKV
jgi:hypothetical protein